MIRVKNTIITIMMSAFLLASAYAFADYSQKQNKVDDKMNSPQADYSQKQNKVDDKMNSPQQSQSGSSMKSDDKMGGQGSTDKTNKDRPSGDATDKTSGGANPNNPSGNKQY